jgi:lipopolysaccharide transport system ATP-binding protein
MSQTVIQVQNLGKRYRIGQKQEYYTLRDTITNIFKPAGRSHAPHSAEPFVWAIKNVSFETKKGEVLGIIGRNGAGKTTLLKILSRITEPTEGKAVIRGMVGSLLEVGTGFHPELSGRENIYLNGAILGMKKREIESKFDAIVDFAEIDKFIDTPVKHYSSGMYVRLAFAVAAFLEHEILLIDEVLAVGDANFQKKCLGKMGEIGTSGRTIIFVSHNMATINSLCSRAILFDKGSIVTEGSPRDCIDRYIDACGQRAGKLIDHQNARDTALQITAVKINGSAEDAIHVPITDEPLELEFEFTTSRSCRVSAYACLKDNQGQALAIYSPGHMNGTMFSLNPGKYHIKSRISLPHLNKGRYWLDFSLADPGVKHYAFFPFGLELQVDGYAGKTGFVFVQNSNDAGFLVLEGDSKIIGTDQ